MDVIITARIIGLVRHATEKINVCNAACISSQSSRNDSRLPVIIAAITYASLPGNKMSPCWPRAALWAVGLSLQTDERSGGELEEPVGRDRVTTTMFDRDAWSDRRRQSTSVLYRHVTTGAGFGHFTPSTSNFPLGHLPWLPPLKCTNLLALFLIPTLNNWAHWSHMRSHRGIKRASGCSRVRILNILIFAECVGLRSCCYKNCTWTCTRICHTHAKEHF